MTFSTAELLAPAGTPEALDAAIGEGADAVYLGLKNFNARLRSANFAFSQFEAATESLHKLGKKIYVTVNTVFEQREADRMYQLLQYLEKVGPDGIIVQDLGVIKLASEHFSGLHLHASTQMNIGSANGANFLSRYNFKRVVLSRELSLAEIKSVRASTNVELETFVPRPAAASSRPTTTTTATSSAPTTCSWSTKYPIWSRPASPASRSRAA